MAKKKTTKKVEEAVKEQEINEAVEIVEKEIEKEIDKPMEAVEKTNFKVHQGSSFIKMVPYRTPIPMYKLPEDIRKYLLGKGFGTNVWEKDDEWLERHGADMKMIEKLKKFISEQYL